VSEALRQARRYLAFADESYVGLPVESAGNVAEGSGRAQFLSAQVGLLGISPEGVSVLIPSSGRKRRGKSGTVTQTYEAERLWRHHLTDKRA